MLVAVGNRWKGRIEMKTVRVVMAIRVPESVTPSEVAHQIMDLVNERFGGPVHPDNWVVDSCAATLPVKR